MIGPIRGTILVASSSELFAEIVSDMVRHSGYEPTSCAPPQPRLLSRMRPQPALVILDGDAPVSHEDDLRADATALGIPILLSRTRAQREDGAPVTVVDGQTWLNFPITPDLFSDTLHSLQVERYDELHRFSGSFAGVGVDAGIGISSLLASPRVPR
jgi:hypothetical protein